MAESKLRCLIRQEIQNSKQCDTIQTAIQKKTDSKNPIFVRLMWGFVTTICFAIFSYQTHERISYYRSGPFRVDVVYSDISNTILPPIRFDFFATRSLSPYWNMLPPIFGPEKVKACVSPVPYFMEQQLNITDYHQLWLDSNFTDSFTYIKAKKHRESLLETKLESGKIESKTGLPIIIKQKATTAGLTTILETNLRMDHDLKLSIQFYDDGVCKNQIPLMTFLNEITPYETIVRFLISLEVEVKVSQQTYNFLPTKQPYCEPDEKKIIECYADCRVEKRRYPCSLPFMQHKSDIPDCGKEKNKTIVSDLFLQELHSDTTGLETLFCKCKRKCEKNIYSFYSTVLDKSENLTIHIMASETTLAIMTEKYIYDLINLLVDLSGNLGLTLGLSLLSVIQLGQSIKYAFTGNNKPILKYRMKEIIAELRISHSVSIQLNFILHSIIAVFGVIFASYITTIRYKYFESEPTRYTVTLQENKSIYLPNVIVCGEGDQVMTYRTQLSKEKGQDACSFDLLELLDLKSIFFTIDKIWSFSPQIDDLMSEISNEVNLFKVNVTYKKVFMHSGSCLEIKIDKLPFVGLTPGIFVEEVVNNCSRGAYEIYFAQETDSFNSVLRSKQLNMPETLSIIVFNMFKKVQLNLKSKPCLSTLSHSKCQDECYQKKYREKILCQLPFMSVREKKVCTTFLEAKKSRDTYINIALHTNVELECGCPPVCELTIFQNTVTYNEPMKDFNLLLIRAQGNLIREFRQVLSYESVALFCDVANIFGLTVGFSLISSPLLVKTLFTYVHRITLKVRKLR